MRISIPLVVEALLDFLQDSETTDRHKTAEFAVATRFPVPQPRAVSACQFSVVIGSKVRKSQESCECLVRLKLRNV